MELDKRISGRLHTFQVWQSGEIVATVSETDLVIAQQKATQIAIGYSLHGPEPATVRGLDGARVG